MHVIGRAKQPFIKAQFTTESLDDLTGKSFFKGEKVIDSMLAWQKS